MAMLRVDSAFDNGACDRPLDGSGYPGDDTRTQVSETVMTERTIYR